MLVPILVHLGQIWAYHPMQFKGKLMKHTWENGKSLVWGRILALLVQIWAPNFFCVDFVTSTRCQKLWQVIIMCNFKEN